MSTRVDYKVGSNSLVIKRSIQKAHLFYHAKSIIRKESVDGKETDPQLEFIQVNKYMVINYSKGGRER